MKTGENQISKSSMENKAFKALPREIQLDIKIAQAEDKGLGYSEAKDIPSPRLTRSNSMPNIKLHEFTQDEFYEASEGPVAAKSPNTVIRSYSPEQPSVSSTVASLRATFEKPKGTQAPTSQSSKVQKEVVSISGNHFGGKKLTKIMADQHAEYSQHEFTSQNGKVIMPVPRASSGAKASKTSQGIM